jgi:hypothetical protein
VLVAGVFHNPSLRHPDHENCVIQTTVINKSSRKAFINGVEYFRDGRAFSDVRIEIMHSFDELPMVLRFDPLKGWQGFFAK